MSDDLDESDLFGQVRPRQRSNSLGIEAPNKQVPMLLDEGKTDEGDDT